MPQRDERDQRRDDRQNDAPDHRFAIPFAELMMDDLPRVGGKNASLGEMIRELGEAGVRIPDGFALTVDAYKAHLREAGIEDDIHRMLDDLDVTDVSRLGDVGQAIRHKIMDARLPAEVEEAARAAYDALSDTYDERATDVAVRSSATAEDLPTASFAGQQETFLNVRGWAELERAIRGCMASLFTDRAIVYRTRQEIPHREVFLSVGVQKMVRSDESSAGVIFTLDTESGFRDVVLITGAWGLGELVVQGRVDPDEYWVHKPTLARGFRPIVRREIGDKEVRMVYSEGGTKSTRVEQVPRSRRMRPVLDDDEILQLARWSVIVEEHYTEKRGQATPMDLEWARDGRSGELFIVQARPETVHSQAEPEIELFRLEERPENRVLVEGKSVGRKVAHGAVRVIHSLDELKHFEAGEILVTEMTDPDWEPVLERAAAVVTDHGGRTCHAAIVSREIGIPCVVGAGNATSKLESGREVTVSCAEGDVGRVYDGKLEYTRDVVDLESLPTPSVPLMMNVANPDQAFTLGQLPSAGVGLLRVEFLVSNWIGVHPMALLHPDRIDSAEARAAVTKRARDYDEPADLFVERMASGVATIAAAFYPRPVIVRFSDFKTNEYAGLLGGRAFEPVESNPMLGWRGASRYYDEGYRDGFALECRAIKQVREEMGLGNVKVMIPFCRTVEEGARVLEVMAENGLARGDGIRAPSDGESAEVDDTLEVYVMCEIPNNVLRAAEFAEHFDGFSIGSNDLTQLTLGVDRDSEILADLFDERDPGVKRIIEMVVEAAHEAGRKVGICGQAPSDYPEFAEFLAEIGIDSMSLMPDAVPIVARRLGGSDEG